MLNLTMDDLDEMETDDASAMSGEVREECGRCFSSVLVPFGHFFFCDIQQ